VRYVNYSWLYYISYKAESCVFDYQWCLHRVQPTRCNVPQFIYFYKTLYMFQTVFPSIIRSSKLNIERQVFVRPITDAVCSVLSSWWWTENPSETWKASYRNKLWNVISFWLYSSNILTIHGLVNVKSQLVSLENFIDKILPFSLCPWGWLSL